MAEGATLTVAMSAETEAQMAALARSTGRAPEALAADALAQYTAEELAIVRKIEAGLAAVERGDVIPHEDVMRDLFARLGISGRQE